MSEVRQRTTTTTTTPTPTPVTSTTPSRITSNGNSVEEAYKFTWLSKNPSKRAGTACALYWL
jgi:hypothetical protein